MGPVGIISKIGDPIVGISVITNSLTDSKLQIPFKKIEIKMGKETVIGS